MNTAKQDGPEGGQTNNKRGRKPLQPGQAKDARIEIRCHPDHKGVLQAKADAAKMSLGAWLVQTGLSARK